MVEVKQQLKVIQNGEEKPALEFKNFISRGDQNDSYNRVWKPDGYCGALNCTKEMEVLEPMVMQIGNIVDDGDIGFKNPQRGRVYDAEGLSPAICTMQSGGTEPKILTPKRTEFGKAVRKDYESGQLQMSRHDMTELEPKDESVSNTITSVQKDNLLMECTYRIRKLTPRECYRLMGVDDANIDTIQSSGISNTQQYKQAGNSIVVDVLYHIFRKMFVEVESESRQLEFF